MKAEELLARSQEEEQSYDPPLFECRVSDAYDDTAGGVWKLQSKKQVVRLFPWARPFVIAPAHDFSLELTEDRRYTKIERVA
jgi:hypothetical protein